MFGRLIGIMGVIAALVLLFFVTITTPTQAGPLGILVVFLCLYVMVFSAVTFFIFGVQHLIVKLSSPFTARKPLQPMSLSKAYYLSSVLSLGPVMLLGMQSVGGIGGYELALVALFMVIGCVYIAKRSG